MAVGPERTDRIVASTPSQAKIGRDDGQFFSIDRIAVLLIVAGGLTPELGG